MRVFFVACMHGIAGAALLGWLDTPLYIPHEEEDELWKKNQMKSQRNAVSHWKTIRYILFSIFVDNFLATAARRSLIYVYARDLYN